MINALKQLSKTRYNNSDLAALFNSAKKPFNRFLTDIKRNLNAILSQKILNWYYYNFFLTLLMMKNFKYNLFIIALNSNE